MRLLDLYRHTDPALARCWRSAWGSPRSHAPAAWTVSSRRAAARCAQVRAYFAESAGAAAKFLARPTARASARSRSTAGTPTPTKARSTGRLAALLGALDGAIAAIETNMGDAWRETVVAVITEFGRTARINGTEGTDHGTGDGGDAGRRRAQGRPRRRRLAGPQAGEPAREAATSSRPPTCAPCSRAC